MVNDLGEEVDCMTNQERVSSSLSRAVQKISRREREGSGGDGCDKSLNVNALGIDARRFSQDFLHLWNRGRFIVDVKIDD